MRSKMFKNVCSCLLLAAVFFSTAAFSKNHCTNTNFKKAARIIAGSETRIAKPFDLYNEGVDNKPAFLLSKDKNIEQVANIYMFGSDMLKKEFKEHQDSVDKLLEQLRLASLSAESAEKVFSNSIDQWYRIRNSCMKYDSIEKANIAQEGISLMLEYSTDTKHIIEKIDAQVSVYNKEKKLLQAGKESALQQLKDMN